MKIRVTVNGTVHDSDVEPRTLLVHYVREALGLTGTPGDARPGRRPARHLAGTRWAR